MEKMIVNFEEGYNDIIKTLMLCQDPDMVVKDSKYYIPSKHLTVKITKTAFYLKLDTSIYHHVPIFRQKGIWKFPFLQFGIQLTASTGTTYSYPSLRDMKVEDQNGLLVLANYMFTCANTAILFVDYVYKKAMDDKFKSPMEGLFTYQFIGGGIYVNDPAQS